VHPEVSAKYYGCGFIAPELLQGQRVLDLGCGAGRDCYVLAQLVGERGQVVGVDMSEDQLATARATIEWHREKFGYAHANTSFKQAFLEKLLTRSPPVQRAPIPAPQSTSNTSTSNNGATHPHGSHHLHKGGSHGNSTALAIDPTDDSDSDDDTLDTTLRAFTAAARGLVEDPPLVDAELIERSFDVIVSNCVVNLSPDKAAVLNNAYRLLKTGTFFVVLCLKGLLF